MQTSAGRIERVRVPIPATNEAAQFSRRLVRTYLAVWHAQDLTDVAQLLTTELVTNVVRHTNSAVANLEMRWHDSTLRIEVSDTSTAPPVERCAQGRDDGYGLRIVATLSDDHGVIARPTGKTVWCTLTLD
jgi:anti-sigma regulatory factor (Ser/Thr protein kinase)